MNLFFTTDPRFEARSRRSVVRATGVLIAGGFLMTVCGALADAQDGVQRQAAPSDRSQPVFGPLPTAPELDAQRRQRKPADISTGPVGGFSNAEQPVADRNQIGASANKPAAQAAADTVGPDSAELGRETQDDRVEVDPLRLPGETAPAGTNIPPLNLLALLMKGRWLMLPIVLMSILVVMIVIERLLAMRRGRVMPDGLVEGLNTIGGIPGVMDPRRAYRLCQQYPSPAAVVIRSMLLKIGRPHSEVEHAVRETSEREAERLYGSVRWLSLIAAVAPLTGLLGTVWGMIRAFYDTTHLPLGQNKAEYLAEGIYVALVTTLGGLVVAIPAAIFAHYFEGRVVSLFHQIDELLFSLMPQVERYEGRMRVTPHSLGSAEEATEATTAQHASQPASESAAPPPSAVPPPHGGESGSAAVRPRGDGPENRVANS